MASEIKPDGRKRIVGSAPMGACRIPASVNAIEIGLVIALLGLAASAHPQIAVSGATEVTWAVLVARSPGLRQPLP
jgi:hypothetical protein